jgi:hypothetical protein
MILDEFATNEKFISRRDRAYVKMSFDDLAPILFNDRGAPSEYDVYYKSLLNKAEECQSSVNLIKNFIIRELANRSWLNDQIVVLNELVNRRVEEFKNAIDVDALYLDFKSKLEAKCVFYVRADAAYDQYVFENHNPCIIGLKKLEEIRAQYKSIQEHHGNH